MPQYLISVWHDDEYGENDFSDPDIARLGQQVGALNEKMEATGAWVFGAGLQPASTATVVRSAGGDVSMTDGPYAETKEQMGGFWVIETADLEPWPDTEPGHRVAMVEKRLAATPDAR